MALVAVRCQGCGTVADVERVGTRDVGARCTAYLHCCRNCAFYEPGLHNDCREPNALALIRAHDLGLGQDMPLDGLQHPVLRCAGFETRRRVERVELEEVAVGLPGWGAGATVAQFPEIVHALVGAAREILVGWHAFARLARGGPEGGGTRARLGASRFPAWP